jgi:predicted outer membrane repeat protein
LNDSASVADNRATDGGGVAALLRGVVLRGSASVTGNTSASGHGGGIRAYADGAGAAPVRLYGSASVVGNTAWSAGGGIVSAADVYLCSDAAAISPNSPDDPPPTIACTRG